MYHDSGLCGFLKDAERISNKKASLCEDLKFAIFINNKQPKELQLPKHKLIMARLKAGFNAWGGFPDVDNYKGYRNS